MTTTLTTARPPAGWPRRPWYVVSPGSELRRVENQLAVVREGEVVRRLPATFIGSVVADASVRITGAAFTLLLRRQIPLVVLDSRGRALGRLEPAAGGPAALRLLQYRLALDPTQRLRLARPMVSAKLHNQRVLLARRARRAGADHRHRLEALDRLQGRAERAGSLTELRGLEGAGASTYFLSLRELVGVEAFRARDRRAPDPTNVLINYVSALLRERVLRSIVSAGLDPTLSALHEPFRGRPTLAFDLMEEWRPILLDAVALSLVGLGQVTAHDVDHGDDGHRLSADARRAAVDAFHRRLRRSAPGTGRTYDTAIDDQVVTFVGHLRGRAPYEGFRWR